MFTNIPLDDKETQINSKLKVNARFMFTEYLGHPAILTPYLAVAVE